MAKQADKQENDTQAPLKTPDTQPRRSKSIAELLKEREAKRVVKY
jgi:hypothetical protein